jgi:hypothetical protein
MRRGQRPLICGNILGTILEPRKAAIPRYGGWQRKISTESRSTHGTFFFAPRYCRHWKDDPTSTLMMGQDSRAPRRRNNEGTRAMATVLRPARD